MAFEKLNSMEDLSAGDHWIGVTKGMSGYFAVDYWMNGKDIPNHVFPEPYQTGMGRYESKEEARAEAMEWAKAEDLPYDL